MKVAILSDLHLYNRGDSERIQLFVKLLKSFESNGIQELWLLGDVFDMMIGPFQFWLKRHRPVFDALKSLKSKGVKILWLEGNHDFLISKLLKPLGIDCVEESQTLDSSSGKILLAHGDEVNQEHLAYLKWRSFTRGSFFRNFVRFCPEWLAEHVFLPFGEFLSRKSRKRHTPTADTKAQKLYSSIAEDYLKKGEYRAVFWGHTHVFDQLLLDERLYLNLGSWFEPTKRYALWDLDSNKLLICDAAALL